MIKLYNDELSGNCYKLRLFMGLLELPYERVPVNFHPGREHKSEAFLQINPFGQLPAIDDDGFVLRDAQAILVYLATRYDGTPEHRDQYLSAGEKTMNMQMLPCVSRSRSQTLVLDL